MYLDLPGHSTFRTGLTSAGAVSSWNCENALSVLNRTLQAASWQMSLSPSQLSISCAFCHRTWGLGRSLSVWSLIPWFPHAPLCCPDVPELSTWGNILAFAETMVEGCAGLFPEVQVEGPDSEDPACVAARGCCCLQLDVKAGAAPVPSICLLPPYTCFVPSLTAGWGPFPGGAVPFHT